MTNKFLDQYVSSGKPSGYEQLRNVRVFGPFWSALLQVSFSKKGGVTSFSLTSVGASQDKPQLVAISAYGIRHDTFGTQSDTTLFAKGVGDNWIADLQPTYAKNGKDVVAQRQHFDTERQMVLSPVTNWPKGNPSLRLPAFKLVEGAIPVDVTARALRALQALLGASKGTQATDTRRVYLTPEGIAFRGSVTLPVLSSDVELSLWLVVTQDGAAGPVLRPWLAAPQDVWPDQTVPGGDIGKTEATAKFAEAIGPYFSAGGTAIQDPKLFDLRMRRPLALVDFQWPLGLEPRSEGRKTVVKRSEYDDAVIETRGEALSLRLSERSLSGPVPPKSSLLILPERVTLQRDGAAKIVKLSGSTGGSSQQQARGDMAYSYRRITEAETNPRERVYFDGLTLHVPLRATRQVLFGAEDGRIENTRRVFVPVQQGWVESDFPTLSVTELADLGTEAPAKEFPAAQTVGAMGIGNTENAASRFENIWNVTVRGADQVSVNVVYGLDAKAGVLRNAIDIELKSPRVASDGLLRIVAMEPSATRLLPDHPERALRARSIEAVDQSDLPLLEREAIEQVAVRLEDVSLDMVVDTGEGGGAELMLQRAAFSYVVQMPLPTQPATLWARHGALPTVQTQNLTQAGADRRIPSGTRELAPLGIKAGKIPFEGLPAGALHCRASKLTSVLDTELPNTKTKMTWNEQLGMAVTTLPSVTLMPLAHTARRSQRRVADAWKTVREGWDTGISAEMQLRYDVALLDGPRANTELPDTEPDISNPAAASQFDTSVSKSSAERAQAHWQAQFSSDVLSAVAWREVLAQRGNGSKELRLTGLGRGSFDLTSDVELTPNLSPHGMALGSYGLKIGQDQELAFFGVPWTEEMDGPEGQSDVSGLSFEVQGKSFLGGSALLEPNEDVLEDQQGGQQSPAHITEVGSFQLIERNVSGAALTEPLTLVSTLVPLEFGEVSLWLSDLALNKRGSWTRDPILGPVFGEVVNDVAKAEAKLMPNAHHPEHNVRIGHRWALSAAGEDAASDLGIAMQGVIFRPIAMSSAQLNTRKGAAQFVISGQIVLHVRSGGVQDGIYETVPTAVGTAQLTLTHYEDGRMTVELSANQLSIPVLDRQSSNAPVSQLELSGVTFGPSGITFASALLHVPMLGHVFSLELTRDEDAANQMTLSGDYSPDSSFNGLVPMSASVTLGERDALGVVEASAKFALGLGSTGGPRLVAKEMKRDLLHQGSASVAFENVDLSVPGMPKGTATGDVELTAAGAALTWRYETEEGADPVVVLPGLSVTSSRGWALGAFAAPVENGPVAREIALQDWIMDLRHWGPALGEVETELRLAASLAAPELNWRISGAWHIENEIRFPLPDALTHGPKSADVEADQIEAEFDQGFATPMVHRATLHLVEHAISPSALAQLAGENGFDNKGPLLLNMLVTHRLEQDSEDPIQWAQYQTVDVYSMASLQAHLEQIMAQGDDVVGWRRHETAGLFSKAHAPKLLQALADARVGIAFDFGALPCFGAPGDGYTLAQLPAFGIIGAVLDMNDTLAEVLNRVPPTGAVVVDVPLVEAAIRFEGPSQAQLARRSGLLAGAAAQFAHPFAQGHSEFILRHLSVAKMPEWSTRQLRETRPYLAAGLGLSSLRGVELAGRVALSLMPMRPEDVVPLRKIKDAALFFKALAEQRIDTFAVAHDGAVAVPASEPERTGLVRAVSGATGKLINPRTYTAQSGQLEQSNYRTYLLQIADPSASIGVVLPPEQTGAPQIARNVNVPSATRPVVVSGALLGALALPERQRLAIPFNSGLASEVPEAARRVAVGLSMQRAEPEILTYPGPEAREDDDAPVPDALMRATRRALRASFAETTTFFSGQNGTAWMSEMSRLLFRPAAAPHESLPATILFDPPAGAPLPVAYDPAGGDILPPSLAEADAASVQGVDSPEPAMYMPAGLTVSRMSQGSGMMFADRLGAAVFKPGKEPSTSASALRARASSAPVFQRAPRPGQLGRKDQLRPSQFETGHVLLSMQPITTLYGKGRAQPIGPDLPPPDADKAFRVRLDNPKFGILTPDWSRTISVTFEPLTDTSSVAEIGKVVANLVLDGVVHELTSDGDESAIRSFIANQEVTNALSTLGQVETARLVLTVPVGDNFVRRLSLDLWAIGDGVPHLAERPLYFLFEDPALDELTRGVSHFAARSAEAGDVMEGGPAISLRIATETEKITPTDSFTLIFGAIDPSKNQEVTSPLSASSSWSMKRIRPIPGETEPPKPEDLALGDITLGKPINFDLTTDFIEADVLLAGDTLQIEWTLNEGDESFGILLYIQIVATARPSSNPASYAVLQAELEAKGFAARCRCLLHQESADPTDRELVDSTRLLQGTAIFRNRFRWRAFLASGSGPGLESVRWAVQKIDGQGSTWLPPRIGNDWAGFGMKKESMI